MRAATGGTLRSWTIALTTAALGLGLGGCVYAPPAPVAYGAPADYGYAQAPAYYYPYYSYYSPYYYPAYYPPVVGSVGFFFGGGGGGHHH